MRVVTTRTGARMPALGLGTWEMGVRRADRTREVAALQLGYDLGMTLVDTAEMYAQGGAEEVVGESLRGRRDGIFVVTKVLPENASRRGTVRAAERSLQRLGIDCIDLFLLHWAGDHPLAETLAGFEELHAAGKIRHWGVSNFDVHEMEAAEEQPGGSAIAADQVYYNLARRGIERRLVPWCAARRIVVMAYSPLDQGRLEERPALREVAQRHDATAAQVAIAWSMRLPETVTIPKAAKARHVRENAAAAALGLDADDIRLLDMAYPAPAIDMPLETL